MCAKVAEIDSTCSSSGEQTFPSPNSVDRSSGLHNYFVQGGLVCVARCLHGRHFRQHLRRQSSFLARLGRFASLWIEDQAEIVGGRKHHESILLLNTFPNLPLADEIQRQRVVLVSAVQMLGRVRC